MILLNQINSAILQLLLFLSVPFMWYVVTHKKINGFFVWLGIKVAPKPPLKVMLCILIGFLVVVFLPYMWLYQSENLNYQGFTVDAFRQSGWSIQTLCVILIWAILQTSLSEEILFRGFLCKRCKNIFTILIVVLLTGGIGYVLGWLSLKKVQGSILYGWVIHATVNILSPIIVFTFLLPNYTVQ